MNTLPSICVCGAGTMGSGIAQVFASKGFNTILYDVDLQVLHAAKSRINRDLLQLADKNKITHAEKAESVSRITFTSNLQDCVADLVIEAVVENINVKCSLLDQLFSINGEKTIFVTNTSSLSVSSIAERLPQPGRFAGMHFFNPATVMKLVEVIKTPHSSDDTIQFIVDLCSRIGKTAVICSDSPGFIVNRVARPYYLEALYLAEKKNIRIETIDDLLETTGFRMGPFKLMDLIGNDINYSVSCIVHEALGKPDRLKPSVIQEKKVKEGLLGRKSGKGYYEYPRT